MDIKNTSARGSSQRQKNPLRLVDSLVGDLTPVRPATTWLSATLGWTLGAWLFVGVTILLFGPLRDGALGELLDSPGSALELGLGLTTGLAAIWAGLEIGVPGAPGGWSGWRLWTPPVLLLTAWLLVLGYAAMQSSDSVSMSGKRAHCSLETVALSLAPLAAALFLLRGRLLFASRKAGFLIGCGAAAIPAAWMQIACMADPLHTMRFHVAPILLVAGLSSFVAHRLLAEG